MWQIHKAKLQPLTSEFGVRTHSASSVIDNGILILQKCFFFNIKILIFAKKKIQNHFVMISILREAMYLSREEYCKRKITNIKDKIISGRKSMEGLSHCISVQETNRLVQEKKIARCFKLFHIDKMATKVEWL